VVEGEARLRWEAAAEGGERLKSGAMAEELAGPRLLVAVGGLGQLVPCEAEAAQELRPVGGLDGSWGAVMEEHLLMAPWEAGEGVPRLADQPLAVEVEGEPSHD
jgi:hypothetical protein